MRALRRKLFRDVLHLRGQLLAIAVVTATGVATVVTTRTGYESLVANRASYYADRRFADVFAPLKRAPESLVRRIAAVPGVDVVESRIVQEVTLDVPGLAEPATGRLVSVPEAGRPLLNDLHIRRGRYLARGRRDEALVSEAFAEANGLTIGDSLGAVINGRWEQLRVVGVAMSPEYVYEIRGTDLFPDNRRFGVIWMSREALGPAFQLDGAFNDLVLTLRSGADEQEVIAQVDRLLAMYGGLGAYGRADQISARFLADEIAQDRTTGTLIPGIFLGIAAFLLNVVLSRLVATQRDQIGTLKAFGYGNAPIARHYLGIAMVGLMIGGAAGIGLGAYWGHWVTQVYARYYRFPFYADHASLAAILLGIGVTVTAAAIGALAAVRRAVALPPAEAMRVEGAPVFRRSLAARLGDVPGLGPVARMIVRSLTRRPLRATVSVVGVGLAVSIVVLGSAMLDAIQLLAHVQFRLVQREDLMVVFNAPRSPRVRHDLDHLPGVLRTEPLRLVPARIRHAHHVRRIAMMGIEPGAELRQLITRRYRSVTLPPEGLVLTAKLGEVLGVGPGDSVTVEVLQGERAVRTVQVVGLVDELLGLSAYMNAQALDRIAGSAAVSAALLQSDPRGEAALHQRLKRTPAVAGVTSREAMLASFQATLAESLGYMITIILVFACGLAAAVVYNAARISLSERSRELASLRVLGFTRGEVAYLLLGEQALLTGVAIPTGLALGYAWVTVLARVYEWELFRLPLVVSARSYLIAAAVVMATAPGSALLVRRRLDRMDLVAVLKTRE
jgi:putative ABC transport system permease protein